MRWLTFKMLGELDDFLVLLSVMGDRAMGSSWRLSDIEASGDPLAVTRLRRVSDRGGPVDGPQLFEMAERGLLLINGSLFAFDSGSSTAWLVIEAVDSLQWRVGTDDQMVHAALLKEFSGIQDPTGRG